MLYTSSEAAKLLQKLNEKLADEMSAENLSSTFNASIGEDLESVRPEYDFLETQKRISALQEKIRRVKHAINVFNCSQKVPELDMTIDQMLILIPQLTKEKTKLERMARTLPKMRDNAAAYRGSAIVDYRYANYSISEAKTAWMSVLDRLAQAQTALDRVNTTERFEIDVDVED